MASASFGNVAKSLTQGSFFTMVLNGVSAVLTLVLHMLLARALGHQGYSDYAYALTWLTVLGLVGVLGLDTAAQRFISSYQATEAWPRLSGFLLHSRRTALQVSLALTALCLVGLAIAWPWMRRELAVTFLVSFLVLPPTSLLMLRVAELRGLRSPLLAAWPRLITRPALLGLMAGMAWLLRDEELPGPYGMIGDFLATSAALGLAVHFVSRKVPADSLQADPSDERREWLSVSLPMLGIALMQLLVRSTDSILVGFLHGTETSGPYSAANRVALLAAFGLMAVNAVLPPLIARFHVRGESRDLQRLVTLAARVTFAFSLLASVAIVLLRDFILNLFGEEFTQASTALAILCAGQLVNAVTGSVGFVLSMTGHHQVLMTTLIGTTAGHALLCLLLIPPYGVLGAACATASAIAASNIILALRCRRKVGIDPSIFGRLGRPTPPHET